MNAVKWEEIKDKIRTQFSDVNIHKSSLADQLEGFVEAVEFEGPIGRIKLEFTEKPRLLEEKTSYSRRIGASVRVEKKYDPAEKVCFMKAFRQNQAGEWQEIGDPGFLS